MGAEVHNKRCTAVRPGGQRCEAICREGTEVCSFHTPELREVMREARAAGGAARAKPVSAVSVNDPDIVIGSATDVVALVGNTINHVRRGTLDPKIANAVGYLASVALRGIEVGVLENRLAQIEAVIRTGECAPASDAFNKRVPVPPLAHGVQP